jgi:hypothetical protein
MSSSIIPVEAINQMVTGIALRDTGRAPGYAQSRSQATFYEKVHLKGQEKGEQEY